jgi:hypothetical protein
MSGRCGHEVLWRRRLSRELVGLIAIKFAALALLWWLFFSPAHRTAVDAVSAGQRLGVTEVPALAPARGATGCGASGD